MAQTQFTAYGDELEEAQIAGAKRRFWRRFTVFVILILLVVGAVALFARRYMAPIVVEEATPDKAVGWLVLRDLSEESADNQEKLFDLYIGSVTVPSAEDGKKRAYKLPEPVKKFSGLFLAGREKKVDEWEKSYDRPPYLRVDYIIKPQKTRTSKYILSSDVAPGPSLEERWNAKREQLAKGEKGPKKTLAEKNVQLLIMQWFATRCKSYDAAPDDQKKAKLDAISAELTNVQGFYNGIREAAKKKPLTQSELLKEFEMSVESWCEFASLEELAKILWFKDLVVGIVANQKAGASFAAFSYPPLVPSKSVSAEDQDSENGQNKLFEFKDGYAGKAADAVRNYFFKPKAE